MMRIHANDKNPVGVSASKIEMAAQRNQSSTGGLANLLELKKNAKVMLTNNVNIDDRLINGQLGTVFDFKFDSKGNIITVYVKFEDEHAGKKIRTAEPQQKFTGSYKKKSVEESSKKLLRVFLLERVF